MDIPTLKNMVASWLQQAPGYFVINSVDLLLQAINDSQQWMQQQYDFKYSDVSVDVSVDLTNGVPLSPQNLHGTSTPVTVKKVLRAFISDGFGGVRPIKYVSRDWQTADAAQRWQGIPYPFAPAQRDMPSYPTFYEIFLVQQGNMLMVYPSAQVVVPQNPLPIFCDVIRYWPQYTGTESNTDPFLQFGNDFLKWDSICRLNALTKEFVPRQEGNVASPTDDRDKAWNDLLVWDANLTVTGSTTDGSLE